jgi:hypothetical protein
MMGVINDRERLAVIESKLHSVQTDLEALTKAVETLTATLEQSKGAKIVLGWITSSVLFIATFILAMKDILHK